MYIYAQLNSCVYYIYQLRYTSAQLPHLHKLTSQSHFRLTLTKYNSFILLFLFTHIPTD